MQTWVYDELGCVGAILDEFCLRNLSGEAIGWVFGVSVFSLRGDHIGWFEDGVLYDVQNMMLGFIPGASGLGHDVPALAQETAMPAFSKRPCAPTLRGRTARPRGSVGWSAACLATYLEYRPIPAQHPSFIPRLPELGHASAGRR